jgi:flagellar biosynthesis/type III secretory pathway M-ring protein FliF/YscJ
MAKVASKKCMGAATAPRWLIVAAFVLIALLVAVLVYRYYVVFRRRNNETFDGSGSGSGKADETADAAPEAPAGAPAGAPAVKAKLVFVYMNGCGWCDRFKPEWEKFVAADGEKLKALGVEAVSYERTDAEAAQYKSHVDGYPSILYANLGSGTVVKYDGERTADALMAFVQKQ